MKKEQYSNKKCQVGKEVGGGRGSDSGTGLSPACFSESEKIQAKGVRPWFSGSKSWLGIRIAWKA